MPKTLHTKLCDMLSIKYPIILAGMYAVAGPTLAAAVSNAGGLGMIGATALKPDTLRKWIRKTRSLTDKPFGVDLIYPTFDPSIPFTATEAELAGMVPEHHIDVMAKVRKDLGIPEVKSEAYWIQLPKLFEDDLDVVVEEGVTILALGLGAPKGLIEKARKRGLKTVIGLAGATKHALRQAESGADIIVAQGHEGGGHTGRIGTLALIPQVVDAVYPIPVVGAGGIGDGRGLAAVLALGGIGVWCGTAFILARESCLDFCDVPPSEQGIHPVDPWMITKWRERIIQSKDDDTVISKMFTGKTARALKGPLTQAWENTGEKPLPMPLQSVLMADTWAGIMKAKKAEYLSPAAGQVSGLLKKERPAREIIMSMVDEAIKIIEDEKSLIVKG